jgi:hypothetical protein
MTRKISLLALCFLLACPLLFGAANNPFSPNAQRVQGPDKTGNQGYPIAVVGAPGGDPVNVNITAGGGGAVTQGTVPWVVSQHASSNPWVVSGTVTANQGTSPWVTSVSNFPATQPVSGTVTANQGTSPWVTSRTHKIITVSFTRPADTVAYAVNDAMTNSTSAPSVITLTGCGRVNGGSGIIKSIEMIDSANQATALTANLWLYDTTYVPNNDNTPFTPSDAELSTLIGVWELRGSSAGNSTAGAGGNRLFQGQREGGNSAGGAIVIPNEPIFVCGGGTTSLFAALVAKNAYTPVSGEVFTFRIHVEQD